MIKIFTLFIFLGTIMGLHTTMNSTISNKAIYDLKSEVLRILSLHIECISVSGLYVKEDNIEFSIERIKLNIIPILPSQVNLQRFFDNDLALNGASFAMYGTASVWAKMGPIEATGDIEINIDVNNFNGNLTLTSSRNEPGANLREFKIVFIDDSIHIKALSKPLNNLKNLFENRIKKHIASKLTDFMTDKIPDPVNKILRSILNPLPANIRIAERMYLRYRFPVAPEIRNDYITTGIEAYFYSANNPIPAFQPDPTLVFDNKILRGMQFFFSDCFFKTGLDIAQKLGFLELKQGYSREGHKADMVCHVDSTPDVNLQPSLINVTGHSTCIVVLDDKPNLEFKVLFNSSLTYRINIKNNSMYFLLDSKSLCNVEYINEKQVDIEWFKSAFDSIHNHLAQQLSIEMRYKGIPLPIMNGTRYTETMYKVEKGYIMIGATPIFDLDMDYKFKTSFRGMIETDYQYAVDA